MSSDLIERLDGHIRALDDHGAGNVERLSFDELCAIRDALEAKDKEIERLREVLRKARGAVGRAGSYENADLLAQIDAALHPIEGEARE